MSLFGPPDIQKMKAKRDVKGLIRALEYKGKDCDAIKKNAVAALGELKDPIAAAPLIAAIKLTPWEEQKAIVDALVNIGTPAVEPLIKALGDENAAVRSRAALALQNIHNERAVIPLIDALRKEIKEHPRGWMIDALGDLGDSRAVEALIEALNDPAENNRYFAVQNLGKLGDAMAVEPLIKALNDPVENNRNLAIETLGILRDTRAFEPLAGIINNKTSNTESRSLAIQTLVKLGDNRTVKFLTGIVKKKTNKKEMRISALQALGELRDARAVEPLVGILNDKTENKEFRDEAIRALVQIGSPSSEPLVTFAVKNKDEKSLVELLIRNLIYSIGSWESNDLVEIFCQIGAPAGELLVDELKYIGLGQDVKKSIANILIKLYKRNSLSEKAKEAMLAQRKMIVSEHRDYMDYNVDSCESARHIDVEGLGIDFPL